MTSSAQLEHEAEQTRAHIEADLDELRARITPGHLLDQLVEYAKESGPAEFTRNLRAQVITNPMPIAVVGAGLAWMALSTFLGGGNASSRWNGSGKVTPGREQFTEYAENASDRAGETAGAWASRASRTADEWAEGAQQTAADWSEEMKEGAAALGDRARSRWHGARDATSDAMSTTVSRMQGAAQSVSDGAAAATQAATDQARRARRGFRYAASSVRSSGGQLFEFLRERPLVLAGLGVVVGALVGAALPATEIENRMMGESSDDLKEDATDLAHAQMKKGASVAESAWEGAKDEAQREGLPGFEQDKGDNSSETSGLVPSAGAGVLESEDIGS